MLVLVSLLGEGGGREGGRGREGEGGRGREGEGGRGREGGREGEGGRGREGGGGGGGGEGGRERHVEVCIPTLLPLKHTELCTFCSSFSITLLRSLSDDLSTIGPLVVPSMCSLC